jgi:hypothetical protein
LDGKWKRSSCPLALCPSRIISFSKREPRSYFLEFIVANRHYVGGFRNLGDEVMIEAESSVGVVLFQFKKRTFFTA